MTMSAFIAGEQIACGRVIRDVRLGLRVARAPSPAKVPQGPKPSSLSARQRHGWKRCPPDLCPPGLCSHDPFPPEWQQPESCHLLVCPSNPRRPSCCLGQTTKREGTASAVP